MAILVRLVSLWSQARLDISFGALYTCRVGRRGLNLVETVIAFTVFGLIAVFTLSLFSSSSMLSRYGEDLTQADNLAQSVLAEYQARAFQLPTGTSELPPPREGWKCVLLCSQVGSYPLDQLRELRVTVTWTYQGKERRVVRSQVLSSIRQ